MPQKIIIIRHGETQYNVEKRLQGWIDVPLNQAGKQQAHKVALRLKGETIHALYSSDQKRAFATAYQISKQLNLKLHKRRALREDRLGIMEGWLWEEEPDPYRQQIWDERDQARSRGDMHWKIEGCESLQEHTDRVKKFFDFLEHNHKDHVVAVVTHGGTINRILEIYGFKQITDEYRGFKNTSVTVFVKKDHGYQIEIDNDISHL
jgi:broad specificity phosphatase PhoE